MFATPVGGMATIPVTLAERLRAEIRLGCARAGHRARRRTRADVDGERFDGVVLVAHPAHAARAVLSPAAPDAAALLGRIDFASVVMVTLVADAGAVGPPLDGSGFVVARTAGLSITACSWGSSKWPQWDDGRPRRPAGLARPRCRPHRLVRHGRRRLWSPPS